jgi:hypothetical protein
MSDVYLKFLTKIGLFTLIVFAIASVLFSTVFKTYHLGFYPYQIILIATVTTIGHLWIVKASGQNSIKFTTAFMASVTLKLIVYSYI